MDCYNDFAKVYDRLIHSDIDYEDWGKKILDICDEHKMVKKDYLDLACGTGNLTSVIGKNFIFTTAIDLSEEMLAIADRKMKDVRMKGKTLCQNICNFRVDKKFDLVTCCLDSTNYILEENDLKMYFKSVFKHLKDNGLFIFDINTEYKIKELLGNNLFNYDDDDVTYIWENELEEDIVNMYLTFFLREGQVYHRFDEHHMERAYSEDFLTDMVESVGFQVIKKLNNYNNEIIDYNTERIAFVLKKRED